MIRLVAVWAVVVASVILFLLMREERLSAQGRIPLGRLRRLWFKAERRRAPRYRVDWPIHYRRVPPGLNGPAKTRDLSHTGVGLMLEERLEVGSQLELQIALPRRPDPFSVAGQVMWVKEVSMHPDSPSALRTFFVGVQFKGIDPRLEGELAEALKRQ